MPSIFEFLKDYKEFFADASKEDLTKAWQEERERQEKEQERERQEKEQERDRQEKEQERQEKEQERQEKEQERQEKERERQYELEKLRLQRGDDAKGLPLAPCPLPLAPCPHEVCFLQNAIANARSKWMASIMVSYAFVLFVILCAASDF